MTISDTTEQAIMALIFNASAWATYADNAATTPQTTTPIAAHTADPGDAGTQSTSETTYTGYARPAPARTSGGWTVASGVATLVANAAFGVQSAGTPTLTHWSVGKTGGGASPILFSGTITPNIVVSAGLNPTLLNTTNCALD
jgi:hypothetical protein